MKYIYSFDCIISFSSDCSLYIENINNENSDLSFENLNAYRVILRNYPVSLLKLILHDFKVFLTLDESFVFDLTKYSV